MKKTLSAILALATVTMLLLSLFSCNNGTAGGDGDSSPDHFYRFYLAKTSVEKESYGIEEKITATIDLSDCTDEKLGFNSVVLTVDAKGFAVSNSYSESGEDELTHTYSSEEADKVTPDTDLVFLEYKGEKDAQGKIVIKAQPASDPKAALPIAIYTEYTLYYAADNGKITFFKSEDDVAKGKNKTSEASEGEPVYYDINTIPVTITLDDNPFIEQTFHVNNFENEQYIFVLPKPDGTYPPLSLTYRIECTEYCYDDIFRAPAGDNDPKVSDDNTITLFMPRGGLPAEVHFKAKERKEFDVTFSPAITKIESLGTTTVTNPNSSEVRSADVLLEFTPEESGAYAVSSEAYIAYYETEEGISYINPYDDGDIKKFDLEAGVRYLIGISIDEEQIEFYINKAD